MLSRIDDTVALQIKLPVSPYFGMQISTFIFNFNFISLMLSSLQDSGHPKILFTEKQLNWQTFQFLLILNEI